jgi:uracil phosphoribosyltransferase
LKAKSFGAGTRSLTTFVNHRADLLKEKMLVSRKPIVQKRCLLKICDLFIEASPAELFKSSANSIAVVLARGGLFYLSARRWSSDVHCQVGLMTVRHDRASDNISIDYENIPELDGGKTVLIFDVVIASGQTCLAAIARMYVLNPRLKFVVCAPLQSARARAAILKHFPGVTFRCFWPDEKIDPLSGRLMTPGFDVGERYLNR